MLRSSKSAGVTHGSWKAYFESVVVLLGHIVVTGVIFISLVATGWAVSFAVHLLHQWHPFRTETLEFIAKFELYLFYGDSVLCAFVLVGGAIRFLTSEWETQK